MMSTLIQMYVLSSSRGPLLMYSSESQTPHVYKKCNTPDRFALVEEYRQLKIVSDALQESGNTILSPTPLEFYEHNDNEFWNSVFKDGDGAPIFQGGLDRTFAYSMTRVYPLPSAVKSKMSDLFSTSPQPHRIRKGHHLAHLLLGSETTVHWHRAFSDTYNFALTREHVEKLGIDTMELSREMARMLAQLHMTARNDARGIKVVLGANITSTVFKRCEPRVWVLGFAHVRKFDFTPNQIHLLMDAFFASEYFPRPRDTDLLYEVFAEAYLKECNMIGDAAEQLGKMFISTLEMDQVRRDNALFYESLTDTVT